MLYQYHCACCDLVVDSDVKECPNCGSHNIRSPFGFWIFCIATCLAVVIVFKVAQVYLHNQAEAPVQPTLLETLHSSDDKS
ncbi:hypothetical protein C3F34_13720 [Acinetobacter sp. ACNIH2]|uniref:hypothetical protein n=1 Tax=Acinetobacter sp. ACNIH2 TaxID=1758189 RepID=UPI000CDBBB94|nr:hypothetical protein [Acinetobacter sp. ACNIH2]AUX86988.1 hypothetical protein C3F34_13720 [Acinetobacter sp. ACNIH2]